jgi:hypothetical protein
VRPGRRPGQEARSGSFPAVRPVSRPPLPFPGHGNEPCGGLPGAPRPPAPRQAAGRGGAQSHVLGTRPPARSGAPVPRKRGGIGLRSFFTSFLSCEVDTPPADAYSLIEAGRALQFRGPGTGTRAAPRVACRSGSKGIRARPGRPSRFSGRSVRGGAPRSQHQYRCPAGTGTLPVIPATFSTQYRTGFTPLPATQRRSSPGRPPPSFSKPKKRLSAPCRPCGRAGGGSAASPPRRVPGRRAFRAAGAGRLSLRGGSGSRRPRRSSRTSP